MNQISISKCQPFSQTTGQKPTVKASGDHYGETLRPFVGSHLEKHEISVSAGIVSLFGGFVKN